MAVKLIDELQKEIKAAGEAVKQEAYEKAYDHVFQILDNLEKLLNDNRYLEGNEITEEDICIRSRHSGTIHISRISQHLKILRMHRKITGRMYITTSLYRRRTGIPSGVSRPEEKH